MQQTIEERAERFDARIGKVGVQNAPAGPLEGEKVAERLRLFEHTEREPLTRYFQVTCRSRRDDDEGSGVRPAFVELPGGMQIAWAVADHRGAASDLRHPVTRSSTDVVDRR